MQKVIPLKIEDGRLPLSQDVLPETWLDEPIFVDANIFLFHAFDDEEHGKAATSFLTRIENEEVEALTSSLVIDEVFFKILVQEAAAHLEKPTIWNIKKAMKEKTFVEKVYAPVLEYKAYLHWLFPSFML